MAWSIWNQNLNKLILRINGEDQVVSPIIWPQLYNPSSDSTTICANPYNVYIGHFGADGSAEKAFIAAITAGTINLAAIDSLVANGQTVAFYNESVGYSTRLEFVKSISGGNSRYTMRFVAYGQTSTASEQYITVRHGNFQNVKSSIGIAYNDASGYFAPYYVESYTVPDGYGDYRIYNMLSSANLLCTLVFDALTKGNTPPTPSSDPYANGGYSSGTDTGTGTFDDTSDAIADPSAPTLSPSIGSFVNQYVVSANALSNFGTWLYSGGNIFDNLAKVFQSPMEAIINVGILPYDPTYDPNAYVDIKVGGLNSNVQARLITNNYEIIDMGTIDFDPFYGSALDYNPYTKCYIYLPYCGTFPLNVDEIMGHKISLKYYCDSLSGDCVAVISDENRVLEQFRGNIFIQIPITARDFSSIYTNALNSAISLAAGIATVAATGGVSAPVAVGMGTSMASNAMNSKTHYSRSGGFSGVAGFMSVQTPYVMITIPRQCLPDKQNEMQGYPLFVTKRLGDFSGFTKVYEIHLDGLDCTDAEMKEIYELLKGGVVL